MVILIRKGFTTDGASVPEEALRDSKIAKEISKIIAKFYPDKNAKQVLDYLIGTPFEMPRLLAAVPHDGLYGVHRYCRIVCDWIYKRILEDLKYDPISICVEHSGIRLFGWMNWAAIRKSERRQNRKLVFTAIVRDRKVPCLVRKLTDKETAKERKTC